MFFAHAPFHRAARYGYAPQVVLNARNIDRWLGGSAGQSSPTARIDSDDTSTTLSLDVPGLAKEHLTIAIEQDVVRIESKADAPRSFKAAYQLPFEVDTAASQATLEHGVLTLKLGKVAPVSRETVLSID